MALPYFNPGKASAAQERYCETNERPLFAPASGYCPHCRWNIYEPIISTDGSYSGINVEEAGQKLITGCPHCRWSFVE